MRKRAGEAEERWAHSESVGRIKTSDRPDFTRALALAAMSVAVVLAVLRATGLTDLPLELLAVGLGIPAVYVYGLSGKGAVLIAAAISVASLPATIVVLLSLGADTDVGYGLARLAQALAWAFPVVLGFLLARETFRLFSVADRSP